MKMLDEVVKAMEYCKNHDWCGEECPYRDEDICYEEDALHYLEEYQRYQNTPSRNGHMALVDYFEESQKNPPLTWDELRTMEGKPVWIESESISVGVSPYWKDWYIVKSFTDDEFMYCNDGYEWNKEMQGRIWQAYRKEHS